MDPIMIALLAKYGVETILEIVSTWQVAGEPTAEEMKQALIDIKPEEYFKDPL